MALTALQPSPARAFPASAPHFLPGALGCPLRPGEFMTTADGGGQPVAPQAHGAAFVRYRASVKCLQLTPMGHGSHKDAALIPSGGLGWDPR